MTTSAKTRWFLGAAAAVVAASLLAVTKEALELEENEAAARADSAFQAEVGSALWMIESRLFALFSPEQGRPYFHYRSFYAPENMRRGWNQLESVRQGEVVVPSPLLESRNPIFRLHFEVSSTGILSSPQVPSGVLIGDQTLATNPMVEAAISCQVVLSERDYGPELWSNATVPTIQPQAWMLEEQSKADLSQKKQADGNSLQSRNAANEFAQNIHTLSNRSLLPTTVTQSVMTPTWVARPEQPIELFLLRRVVVDGSPVVQGIWVDWPKLHDLLIQEVRVHLADARIVPIPKVTGTEKFSARLAGLPAILVADPPKAVAPSGLTPIRLGLIGIGAAALMAFAGLGLAMRALQQLLDRRSRFVGAVTHELRTPLTTFRLYSQMLADGMVPESARPEYLSTLSSESERLSRIVESVLLYARLEEGRGGAAREHLSGAALWQRLLPALEQRAMTHGLELVTQSALTESHRLRVDSQAVEQILVNLVDNAGKYARRAGSGDGEAPRATLEARPDPRGRGIEITLTDNGPGIPPELEASLFEPFRRGAHHESGTIPGVGLGLVTAREMARAEGGDLESLASLGGGASFRLRLPTV